MTNEGNRLIEENINLIYNYFVLKGIMDEDLRQELFLKCCEIIDKYDPSKAKLSTFLYRSFDNYIRTRNRMNNMKCRSKISEAELEDDAIERIVECRDNIDVSLDRMIINDIIDRHNDEMKKIIKLHCKGFTNQEIADIINRTRQHIWNKVNDFRNELRSELYEKGCN